MLHPDFPVVEGRYLITSEWAVKLPQQFNQRFEDDALVLWRPGITAWIVVWNNDNHKTQPQRLEWLRSDISPDAFDVESVPDGDVTRFSYRLNERRDDETVYALYGFVIGDNSHVQIAIYFDNEADLKTARVIITGLEEVGAS
jgi:hypothetical protein